MRHECDLPLGFVEMSDHGRSSLMPTYGFVGVMSLLEGRITPRSSSHSIYG
ncbi:hypothetical protein [Marinomonas rhizomae]|uniref:hypothetical protein n=1 Tax=Marinomonas rhizomae TaxID=491948 RepID=UPI00131482BD|nr:hypothetical protein [Marinomonas rhizomae]